MIIFISIMISSPSRAISVSIGMGTAQSVIVGVGTAQPIFVSVGNAPLQLTNLLL
jgi:hypothetical protein